MLRTKRYTVEDLRQAVAGSRSFAQALAKLGLRPAGGNYKNLRENLRKFGIDYTHFSHQAWLKGQTVGPRRPLDVYLSADARYGISSNDLKRRLIREGILEARCSGCKLMVWQARPIPLELDHMNGRNKDNRLENLRLLCPNCHALTPTYRGKNKGKYS